MSYTVWIFGDLPVGRACGPSYMVESWQRELGRQGVSTRLFTPSGGWRERSRTPSAVTYRTVRHVGFNGDYHARFSSLAELWRARTERPDVVLVTTPGRVGVLGITLAARFAIPLVLVVSTDTTGAVRHYNAARLFASGGSKPVVLLWAAPRVRAAVVRRSSQALGRPATRAARVATRCANALLAQVHQLVLLSHKSVPSYGGHDAGPPITVLPAGIDRLPPAPAPAELVWRPGALRVLYVGRFAPEKSLQILVRALRIAVDAGVDAHLTMVGEGHLAGDLAAEAARLGVADRMTLIGPYERSRLRGIYASAHVFAFPSVVETQAFVLNEAAHEGLPLLVCDPDVNPVVCDGDSALVVAQHPEAFAEGLRLLLAPELRARLGAQAQRRAQDLQEAAQTAQLASVLQAAAGARPAQALTGGTASI